MGGTTLNLKSNVGCARYYWMPYPKDLCDKYNVECITLSLYVSNWLDKPERDKHCDKLLETCEQYEKGECDWCKLFSIFIRVARETKSKLVRHTLRNGRKSKCIMINYFQ